MFPGVAARDLTSVDRLRTMATEARVLLGQWMGGQPINSIQQRLDAWKDAEKLRRRGSRKKQGKGGKQQVSATSAICRDARSFVLQGVRDLSYRMSGLPMVYCMRASLDEAPAALHALSGCVREGFDSPEQLASFIVMSGRSASGVVTRMRTRREFDALRAMVAPATADETGFRSVLHRVRDAWRDRDR